MVDPVIWFTGISGSGKTTLATRVHAELKKQDIQAELLDGDVVRDFFEGDLGYSRAERILNVRRIAFAAMLLAKNGIPVLVANIAPYYEVRDFIRRILPHYSQIYLKATVGKVMVCDVKGIYAKAHKTNYQQIIGVGDAYDVPRNPDLVVDTDHQSVDESVGKIMDYLKRKVFINV